MLNLHQRKLLNVLKDNGIERFVGNKKRGKLDVKKLHRAMTSPTTPRVYKRKEERKNKDYSLSILLDNSGSMDEIYHDAVNATIHLARQVEEIGMPASIFCFGEFPRQIKTFDEVITDENHRKLSSAMDRIRNAYAYSCMSCKTFDVAIKIEYSKRQNQNLKICLNCGAEEFDSFGARLIYNVSNGGTTDSIALHAVCSYAYKNAKKNILVVITDGMGSGLSRGMNFQGVPASKLSSAERVLAGIRKTHDDLIVLAIGIGYQPTAERIYGKRFYATVDSNRPEEIIGAVSKLLTKHITRS